MFCREALADLADQRSAIEAHGVRLAVVHMGQDELAAELCEQRGIGDIPRFGDPEKRLYAAFELRRGGLRQLVGPKVILRAVATLFRGHRAGKTDGDPRQMPGVFVVRDGRIVARYFHTSAADRPSYAALAGSIT